MYKLVTRLDGNIGVLILLLSVANIPDVISDCPVVLDNNTGELGDISLNGE